MGGVVQQGCVKNRIRSFVILDLETTGLPYDKPVKITEISMVAALREHITEYRNGLINGVAVPRVLSKLSICISPRRRISKRASDITRTLNLYFYMIFAADVRLDYILVDKVFTRLILHRSVWFNKIETKKYPPVLR